MAYYFSTHGCALGVSFVCFSGFGVPLAAAAFLALMSKKLAMIEIDLGQQSCERYVLLSVEKRENVGTG